MGAGGEQRRNEKVGRSSQPRLPNLLRIVDASAASLSFIHKQELPSGSDLTELSCKALAFAPAKFVVTQQDSLSAGQKRGHLEKVRPKPCVGHEPLLGCGLAAPHGPFYSATS
jgi:hypothetical protein